MTLYPRLAPLARALAVALVALLTLTACDSTDANRDDDRTANDEAAVEAAAASLGGALAEDTGGTVDLIDDLALVTTRLTEGSLLVEGPVGAAKADGPCRDAATLSYDPSAVTWTLVVDCALDDGTRTASFARTYAVQFRDANGDPMANYTVGARTATTLALDIVSGTTTFDGPRLTADHTLDPATWTLGGIDTPATFVIDGRGGRSGTDVVTGERGTRTSTFTLATTLTGLAIDRDAANDVQGGTLTGRFATDVTVEGAEGGTASRTFDLAYTVTFTGGGTATVEFDGTGTRFDGTTFAVSRSFTLDWRTGETTGVAA